MGVSMVASTGATSVAELAAGGVAGAVLGSLLSGPSAAEKEAKRKQLVHERRVKEYKFLINTAEESFKKAEGNYKYNKTFKCRLHYILKCMYILQIFSYFNKCKNLLIYGQF